MPRRRRPSAQMVLLLDALLAQLPGWCHGYQLMKATGLASGTIYPLLMRLASEGMLDASWQADGMQGRPPRHIYRLTPAGQALAASLAGDAPLPDGLPA